LRYSIYFTLFIKKIYTAYKMEMNTRCAYSCASLSLYYLMKGK